MRLRLQQNLMSNLETRFTFKNLIGQSQCLDTIFRGKTSLQKWVSVRRNATKNTRASLEILTRFWKKYSVLGDSLVRSIKNWCRTNWIKRHASKVSQSMKSFASAKAPISVGSLWHVKLRQIVRMADGCIQSALRILKAWVERLLTTWGSGIVWLASKGCKKIH